MADVDISDLPVPPDSTDISDLPDPSAVPQTVGGAAQAVTSGLLSGAGPDLVGMPMDTLQNSVGLLQAGAGALLRGSTTTQALPPGETLSKNGRAGILPNGMYHWRAADGTEHMGRTPPPADATAPTQTRPGPVPGFLEDNVTDTPWWGSSQWVKDILPAGMVTTRDDTQFNRYLHAGAEAIPASTMGNTGAAWKAVAAGTAAGLAQQAVVENGGSTPFAAAAGLLAGGLIGHAAAGKGKGGATPEAPPTEAPPTEAPPAVEPEVHSILSQPLADGTRVPEAPPKSAPDPLNRAARGAEGAGGTGITVGRQTVGNGVNPTDAAAINQATHATAFPGASTPPAEAEATPAVAPDPNSAPAGPPSGVGAKQGGAIGFGKQGGVGRGRSTPLDDLTVVPLPPTDGNQAESSGGGETVPPGGGAAVPPGGGAVPPVDRTMFGPRPQFGPSQVEPTPEGQANRTQTFQRLGMDEVPTSAITGDYRAAADDYVTAQLRGTSKENSASNRLGGVMDANRAAVEKAAADLAAGTGGLTGPETTTTKQDNDTRGRAMNAPITGLHDLVEQRMNEAYDAAEARQTGPVQLTELQDLLQNQRSAFKQVTANNGGMALHDAVSEKIRELGLDGNPTNPDFKPATTMQARALRQYVTGAWTPQNSRLVSEIKNRIDAGVVRAAGADFDEPARQLRTLNSVYLEEPEGVSQLLDQTKGNRLKINRTIDFDQVPQHVTSMAPDQFQHYLDVLKLGYQSGDPTLMAQSADAMRAVRAHLASGVTDMGRKTGAMWNAAGVNQYLRNNEPNMRAVFSPAEMSRYQDIDNAGRWLHTDKSYKGAAVQGHNLDNTIELGNGMLEAGGLHLGGPAGFVGGKLAGMGIKALNNAALRRVAESRITPISGAAEPVVEESPSSAGKPPSGVGAKEGGAIGLKDRARPRTTADDVLTFRHFSNATNPNVTLDPGKMGTGIRGEESRRMINNKAPKSIAVYAGDHPNSQVEPELRGKTEYSVQVPAKSMYDLSADPKGFVDKATDDNGNYNHSKVENTIKGAGYAGYHLPDADGIFRGQGRIFKPTPATRVNEAGNFGRGPISSNSPFARQRGAVDMFRDLKLRDNEEDLESQKAPGSKLLPGVHEIPFDQLEMNTPIGAERKVPVLASAIQKSKEISPVLVHEAADGSLSVREGLHRAHALSALGYDSVPARVATDRPIASDSPFARQRGAVDLGTGDDDNVPGARVNVGLHVGNPGEPGFRVMHPDEVVNAIQGAGRTVGKTSVVQSNTEPTLVADLNQPFGKRDLGRLSASLQQGAIAQQHADGTGLLAGPKAKDWGGAYHPDFFREHNGQTTTEVQRGIHPASTVNNAQRSAFPGIYDPPSEIMGRVRPVAEDPLMREMFGVTRKDLHDVALSRGDVAPKSIPGVKESEKATGAKAAKNVTTAANAARLRDVIAAFKDEHEDAYHGMAGWYVMDPLHRAVEKELGPGPLADATYSKLNTFMGMASPGSDVNTEINRGTAAYMSNEQGKLGSFIKYGGKPAGSKGKPAALAAVTGHPYHSTAHGKPMQRYAETGVGALAPKTAMYIAASERGGSEGYQNKVLVGDSHFSRGVGLSDVRTAKDVNGSISGPELATVHPWYHENVAKPSGLPGTSAQAVQWGALAHETGVDTPIGAPKLELFTQQVRKAAARMGITPQEALSRIIRGTAHAG